MKTSILKTKNYTGTVVMSFFHFFPALYALGIGGMLIFFDIF